MSLPKPNYTQIPNILLDALMADMSNAELRVVLAAARMTFGYHAERAEISLSLFATLTGMSRQGVVDGVTAAKARGLLIELPEKGRRGTAIYKLVVSDVDQSAQPTSQPAGLVNDVDQSTALTRSGLPGGLDLVKQVDTLNKRKKEKKDRSSGGGESRARETVNPPIDPPTGPAPTPPPTPADPIAASYAQPLPPRPPVYALYEQNIGLLTPIIRDQLVAAERDYPAGWLEDAIRIAVEAGARNWRYVAAVLNRWQREGRAVGTPMMASAAPKPAGRTAPPAAPPKPVPADQRAPQVSPFKRQEQS